MKKIFFIFFSLFGLTCFGQNDIALVNKCNGYYIFCDNVPQCEYEIVGEEKVGIAYSSSQYLQVRDRLIEKIAFKYPDADAVILQLIDTDNGTDKAIAINFKDKNRENYAKATVKTRDGVFIFTDCEPFNKYDVAGRTDAMMATSGQYSVIRNKLIKKSKKMCPNAEGVILNFSTGGIDKAVIITF